MPAAEVQNRVTANELVIGVEIDGEARAYPINMLTGPRREIINDRLGQREIAVMWCHLCHSGIVFDRAVGDKTLTFVVSGMLWKRTLVMKDLETGSLWSLIPGRSMAGPLEGTPLEIVPSRITTWKQWRDEHPETTVLNMSRTSRRFAKDYYRAPDKFVYGIVRGGQPFHVSMAALAKDPVQNFEIGDTPLLIAFDRDSTSARAFSRRVGEQVLTFDPADSGTMTDRETGSTWDLRSGEAFAGPLRGRSLEPLVGTLAFDHSWAAFHPRSRELP